jgi:TonB family protein
MLRRKRSFAAFCFLLAAMSAKPANVRPQLPDSFLTRLDEAHLDSLAALTAQKIREAKLVEKEPSVLVMDFFRNSLGNHSRLGTLLADRFSESLTSYAVGIKVLDRKILKAYLTENWTTLEDLRSNEICLRIARQLGATGAILGTLNEENGNLNLSLHLEGFGPPDKEDDLFPWRDRTTIIPLAGEIHSMLFEPGPNYARKADEIPDEPGIFRSGSPGVTSPICSYCPQPSYSDAARTAKFQGTVILSVVVTEEGEVTSVYVLKGAPFGLTAQTIEATRGWRFKPGQKDGKPLSVRVETETTFHLY